MRFNPWKKTWNMRFIPFPIVVLISIEFPTTKKPSVHRTPPWRLAAGRHLTARLVEGAQRHGRGIKGKLRPPAASHGLVYLNWGSNWGFPLMGVPLDASKWLVYNVGTVPEKAIFWGYKCNVNPGLIDHGLMVYSLGCTPPMILIR